MSGLTVTKTIKQEINEKLSNGLFFHLVLC